MHIRIDKHPQIEGDGPDGLKYAAPVFMMCSVSWVLSGVNCIYNHPEVDRTWFI